MQQGISHQAGKIKRHLPGRREWIWRPMAVLDLKVYLWERWFPSFLVKEGIFILNSFCGRIEVWNLTILWMIIIANFLEKRLLRCLLMRALTVPIGMYGSAWRLYVLYRFGFRWCHCGAGCAHSWTVLQGNWASCTASGQMFASIWSISRTSPIPMRAWSDSWALWASHKQAWCRWTQYRDSALTVCLMRPSPTWLTCLNACMWPWSWGFQTTYEETSDLINRAHSYELYVETVQRVRLAPKGGDCLSLD